MARTRRRSGTGCLILVVLVLIVVGALVVGDRYAHGRVERTAASQLQGQLGTPAAPSVDVEGWPFLTQVLRRDLRRVHVLADDARAAGAGQGGKDVRVQHIDLVLSDVTSSDWFQTMTARHAQGTALMAYADLGSLSSVPLTYAGNGRLQVEQQVSILGAQLDATITGTPRFDVGNQTITLRDATIDLGGVNIPQATADSLLQSVLKPIPVTGLPFGLTLSSVDAQDDGLHLGLQGDDVRFRR